jgi:hypothetical protein
MHLTNDFDTGGKTLIGRDVANKFLQTPKITYPDSSKLTSLSISKNLSTVGGGNNIFGTKSKIQNSRTQTGKGNGYYFIIYLFIFFFFEYNLIRF